LHDTLTGLPNRALICDRLIHCIEAARRHKVLVGVLFVDLDNFKDVNDSFGHGVGDELLQAVADRLQHVVRGGDTVGRFGGDEFVVITEQRSGSGSIELVAERIVDTLNEPFRLDQLPGTELAVHASVGVAVGADDSPDGLLRNADVALYRAKTLGKNRFAVFSPEMHESPEHRLRLQADIRQALAGGELFLVYQPIIDLQQLRPFGVEAQLRWQRPDQGVMEPADLLALIDEEGLEVESAGGHCRRRARRLRTGSAAGFPCRSASTSRPPSWPPSTSSAMSRMPSMAPVSTRPG
jgi:diguanylate cyclase (GGDEF)-like protein